MTKQPTGTPLRVPTFPSVDEAAGFWDTHSPANLPDDFAEAPVPIDRSLIKRGLTVELSAETIGQLRTIAQAQGIGPSTLARMWILERLQGQHRKKASASSST